MTMSKVIDSLPVEQRKALILALQTLNSARVAKEEAKEADSQEETR